MAVLSSTTALAETKKVEIKPDKPELIDVIASMSSVNCGSLLATPKIKSQAENGVIEIRMVPYKLPEGPCKGKSLKVLAVGYMPNRGFTGTDTATITYRAPRRDYYVGQDTRLQTVTYKITVK